jgi:hypothetical protein
MIRDAFYLSLLKFTTQVFNNILAFIFTNKKVKTKYL